MTSYKDAYLNQCSVSEWCVLNSKVQSWVFVSFLRYWCRGKNLGLEHPRQALHLHHISLRHILILLPRVTQNSWAQAILTSSYYYSHETHGQWTELLTPSNTSPAKSFFFLKTHQVEVHSLMICCTKMCLLWLTDNSVAA